jgi:hypothetical protein
MVIMEVARMAVTGSNHSQQQPCDVCSAIPPELWATTGQGESLHPEIECLVRLDIDRSYDLYECPGCGALFEWEDLPQTYGSGNCDEERLTRLNPEQMATARILLDPDPEERDNAALLHRALQILSPDLVYHILGYLAARHKQAFSGFLDLLVAQAMAEGGLRRFEVMRTYCGYDRERLREMVRLLDAGGPDINWSAQYFRDSCVDLLKQFK